MPKNKYTLAERVVFDNCFTQEIKQDVKLVIDKHALSVLVTRNVASLVI